MKTLLICLAIIAGIALFFYVYFTSQKSNDRLINAISDLMDCECSK